MIRKIFDMFCDIVVCEGDDYDMFWENFGCNLKLGVIEDMDNCKDLVEFLRFITSKSGDDGELRGLDDYLNDMLEG